MNVYKVYVRYSDEPKARLQVVEAISASNALASAAEWRTVGDDVVEVRIVKMQDRRQTR